MTTLLAIWLIPMSICLILLFTRPIPEEEIGSLPMMVVGFLEIPGILVKRLLL